MIGMDGEGRGYTDEAGEEELVLVFAGNHEGYFDAGLACGGGVIDDSPALGLEEGLEVLVVGDGPVEAFDLAVGVGDPEGAAGDGQLVVRAGLGAGELDEGPHEESVGG